MKRRTYPGKRKSPERKSLEDKALAHLRRLADNIDSSVLNQVRTKINQGTYNSRFPKKPVEAAILSREGGGRKHPRPEYAEAVIVDRQKNLKMIQQLLDLKNMAERPELKEKIRAELVRYLSYSRKEKDSRLQ